MSSPALMAECVDSAAIHAVIPELALIYISIDKVVDTVTILLAGDVPALQFAIP